jgi:hypothetical protein
VLRDLPLRGKPLYLRWRIRRFRCPSCSHRSRERHEAIPPRARATPRFERYLYERTRPGPLPLSHVARTEGVAFYRVQAAHTKGARGELDPSPPRIRVLAVDEASFKRGQDYNTVISAPELGRAIELVRGRDGADLRSARPGTGRARASGGRSPHGVALGGEDRGRHAFPRGAVPGLCTEAFLAIQPAMSVPWGRIPACPGHAGAVDRDTHVGAAS